MGLPGGGGLGLIPAHAGKTRHPRRSRHLQPAHPRSRGENEAVVIDSGGGAGSSPLTRGKHPVGGAGRGGLRLIPAHAGKTEKAGIPAALGSAHPRSRGENFFAEPLAKTGAGSSPLTRGKRLRPAQQRGRFRLIPAHAGKTKYTPDGTRQWAAHPRSRGENSSARIAPSAGGGSSPLTRGKRIPRVPIPCQGGLIPAHAGKTSPSLPPANCQTAHPRSRGENHPNRRFPGHPRGSSPLTRGKLNQLRQRFEDPGLIPAHAGKTGPRGVLTCPPRAHPRSRGENTVREVSR